MRTAVAAVVAALMLTACSNSPDVLLEGLSGTVACDVVEQFDVDIWRCDSPSGRLVAMQVDNPELVAAVMLDNGDGPVVIGDGWSLSVPTVEAGREVASQTGGRLVVAGDDLRDCPDDPEELRRVREAMGDPDYC